MKQPAKAKYVRRGDWSAHTPDGWSIDDIVCENINDAIEYFIGEINVHPIMEKPGALEIYGGFDSIFECRSLREAFGADMEDWRDNLDNSGTGLAWADYLEKLAADIRKAVANAP